MTKKRIGGKNESNKEFPPEKTERNSSRSSLLSGIKKL